MNSIVETVRQMELICGVKTFPPARPDEIHSAEQRLGVRLPESYKMFLRTSNGMVAANGYEVIYGVGDNALVDVAHWNDPQTWKFAWPIDLSHLVFLAGDAGGGGQVRFRSTEGPEQDLFYMGLGFGGTSLGHIAPDFSSWLDVGFRHLATVGVRPGEEPLREKAPVIERHDAFMQVPLCKLGMSRTHNPRS